MVMIQLVSEYVFLARRRSTPAGVASSSRLSTQGSQIGGSAERFSVVANELSTASELPLESSLHLSSTSETLPVCLADRDPARGPQNVVVNNGPYQPLGNDLQLGEFPKRTFGQRLRSFQEHWYTKFVWLEYSPGIDAAFCFPCRLTVSVGLDKHGKPDQAFISRGFKNWKSALSDFRDHETSLSHRSSMGVWQSLKQLDVKGSSVAQQMSSGYQAQILLNRSNVKKIFEAILFLGRQGLPLRGHDETDQSLNRGNFLELLELMSRSSPDLKRHLQGRTHYTSPSSQNAMISLIGDNIQRTIVKEAKESGMFAVICDETVDLSKVEQMSVCIRYVTNSLQVRERFLGFWPLARTDGESLFQLLTDVMSRLDLPMALLRAQCYDGAANMRGRYSGLASRVREVAKKAVYVHCYAHQLNLTVQDACKGSVRQIGSPGARDNQFFYGQLNN